MSDSGVHALGAKALPADEIEGIQKFIESWTTEFVTDRLSDWATRWSEDGLLMPPGDPRVVGRSNILHYATHNFYRCSGFRLSEWSITGADELAVVANRIELNAAGEDGPSAASFNQMILLRRDAEQAWCVQAVIFSAIE